MTSESVDVKRLLKESKKLILSESVQDVTKGLKTLKKVILNDPENLWAFIYYGVGAFKSEKHRHEAVAAFRTATTINADSVEAWKGLRSCLEAAVPRTEEHLELLVQAYVKLLSLEQDAAKWHCLYNDVTAPSNLPPHYTAAVLGAFIGDYASDSFKHRTACEALSTLALQNENLLLTNSEGVLSAFKCWVKFLDFFSRPEFCKTVCGLLTRLGHFSAMSSFLHHTLLVYDNGKLYTKLQLVQYIIDIALDNLYNVEVLIPLIKDSIKGIEDVKSFTQIKLALSIISFFQEDFVDTREHLEKLSYIGDKNATVFLLKFLCKVKDYESVLSICSRFAWVFSKTSNDSLKYEFISCLTEALSCCNDVVFLRQGVRLGIKSVSRFGEKQALLRHLCYCHVGLLEPEALLYLDKLSPAFRQDTECLLSLLKQEEPDSAEDTDRWTSVTSTAATQHLICGNIKPALRMFAKIGTKDKCVSDPFVILGENYLSKGDVEKASACFQRAFMLRPLDSEVLKRYLDALFKLGDEERALRVINSALGRAHFVSEKALFASGLIYSAKYDHEKSVRSFKHLIKLNPECLEFVEAVSDEYVKSGRLGIAENYVSRLVADDPYDLHPLLLLSHIYKLDVNYSSYFNHSVRCLNFKPDELPESERVMKLILCFLLNFLKNITELEESSQNFVRELCEKALDRIERVMTKQTAERTQGNEYLVALYSFIESHFYAAVKLLKCRAQRQQVETVLRYCLKALCRMLQVYGANHIALWKLLGDVLVSSAELQGDLDVPLWLVRSSLNDDSVSVCSAGRLHLAVKCYVIALHLASDKCPKRVHEFYYDISVALICLSGYSKSLDSEFRYYCLKSSLESCLKSFKHSDGVREDRWIHSNLLGSIVSMLGVKENMFKEHFSSREQRLTDGSALQNYAVHLAKSGLLNHAEETFEQARLRIDMDYPSSWVGQLLMQIVSKDSEAKKLLEYHLSQVGNHRLFRWILAYFLVGNKVDIHGGQYSVLNSIFSVSECLAETNPYRLTLMAYVHEYMGNVSLARRLYFRVLRLAKHCDEETYNIFVGNAVRLNQHCQENCHLIALLESNFSAIATDSALDLDLHHLSLPAINKIALLKCISTVKDVSVCLDRGGCLSRVVPLIGLLTDVSLFRYASAKAPFVLEYLLNYAVLTWTRRKREFKQLISSLDNTTRETFLKNINKFVAINNFRMNGIVDSRLISVSATGRYSNNPTGPPQDSVDLLSAGLSAAGETCTSLRTRFVSSSHSPDSPPSTSSPSANIIRKLRKCVFPLPLTDDQRLLLKKNKQLQRLQHVSVGKAESKRPDTDHLLDPHGCHSTCNVFLSLLHTSVSTGDHAASLKYARLCIGITCDSCLNLNKMLPLVSYVSVESKSAALLQRALHLYPHSPVLRKTALLFFCGSDKP